MSRATPGPWKVDGKPEAEGHQKVTDAHGGWVARVHKRNGDRAEVDANALLIAASPDLFAVVQRLFDVSDCDECEARKEPPCLYCEARAAMRKAQVWS